MSNVGKLQNWTPNSGILVIVVRKIMVEIVDLKKKKIKTLKKPLRTQINLVPHGYLSSYNLVDQHPISLHSSKISLKTQ